MIKLLQAFGVLIALVAGVVAVIGYIQLQDGSDTGNSILMLLYGFVAMAVGIVLWLGARAIDWWRKT